ncbi:hypothetical protein [Microseira wollei]|uniref:Uncharacterized protein n=1 Tax=Microseira wollei NIES-4236 TaxID=2530354 RepID=A0AAV3XEE0_9CYAN|nr:hypothetical protein [Microseira wollei]GET39195.1 hypothetical protein MiSe_39590 [Microseira wollei NIES-4236]
MVRLPMAACHLLLLQFFIDYGMWAVMVFPLPVQPGSKLCQDRDNDLVIFAEAGANSYLEKPTKRQITD